MVIAKHSVSEITTKISTDGSTGKLHVALLYLALISRTCHQRRNPFTDRNSKVLREPHGPVGWRWSPVSLALGRTQPKPQNHRYGASASRGMPVYSPSFRWYWLTDPEGMARWVGVGTQKSRAGLEPTTSRSQVQRSTTRPVSALQCTP